MPLNKSLNSTSISFLNTTANAMNSFVEDQTLLEVLSKQQPRIPLLNLTNLHSNDQNSTK